MCCNYRIPPPNKLQVSVAVFINSTKKPDVFLPLAFCQPRLRHVKKPLIKMITGHYVNMTERGLTSDWGEVSAIIRSVVHSRFTHEINGPVHELRVQYRYLIATFSIFTIVTPRTLHLAVNVVTFSAEETEWGWAWRKQYKLLEPGGPERGSGARLCCM
jgi:hypothetical protein